MAFAAAPVRPAAPARRAAVVARPGAAGTNDSLAEVADAADPAVCDADSGCVAAPRWAAVPVPADTVPAGSGPAVTMTTAADATAATATAELAIPIVSFADFFPCLAGRWDKMCP